MGLSLTWLGHAGFLIKADGKNIYIDPYTGNYEDKADVILITHSHFDHCDSSGIRRIHRDDTLMIGPENCVSKIRGKVKTLKVGETFALENMTVEAVEAYNYKRFRSPGVPFHPKGFGVGYLITIGDKTIYHAGDTDFIPEMRQLKNVTVALLPSGDTYTMDNDDVAEAALAISPKVVVPMHRWDSDPSVLKKRVESGSGIVVKILEPGESMEID